MAWAGCSGFTSKRGRERLLRSQSAFQAGTLVAKLDNRDRRFDPTNAAGPYWPNVQPEKMIQIGATWSSTYYPIWTGFIDDWPQSWPGFSEGECAIAASDLFKHLALARILSTGYPGAMLALSPTAYYRLGDVVGSTQALDSSGNGRNATTGDTVTFGAAGAMPADPSTSALFAGAPGGGGKLLLPDLGFNVFQSGTTIVCWWKGTGTTGDFIVAFPPSAGHNWCAYVTSAGAPQFNVGGVLVTGGGAPINDGNFHHLVFTCGLGSGGTQVYVDGALVGSSASEPASWPLPASNGVVAWGTDDQTMQELAFLQYQLSGAQVAALYEVSAFPAQKTGQAVTQLLNLIGMPSSLQNVDTGFTFCQADTQNETQTKVLDQLQKYEQSEQGQCYVSAAGQLTFEDRYHRYRSPDANSVATIDDYGSSNPGYAMGGVTLNFDRMELWNDVPVTRRGGILQEASSAASITEFTNRTMTGLSDLMMDDDADALLLRGVDPDRDRLPSASGRRPRSRPDRRQPALAHCPQPRDRPGDHRDQAQHPRRRQRREPGLSRRGHRAPGRRATLVEDHRAPLPAGHEHVGHLRRPGDGLLGPRGVLGLVT